MASQNPTEILLESADTLQSIPPPDALQKLTDEFFINENIPLDIKFKALRVKDFLSLTFIHYICMACKDIDVSTFVSLFKLCLQVADKYAAEHPSDNPVKTRLQLNLLSSTGQNVLHLLAQQKKPHLIDALLQLLLQRDQTHLIKPLATDKIGRSFLDLLLHWGKGDDALAIVTKYEHHFGFAEAKKSLSQKLYLLKEKESVIKQKSKEETKDIHNGPIPPSLTRLESLSAVSIDKVSFNVTNDPVQQIRRQIYKEGEINSLIVQNLATLPKDSLKHLTLDHLQMNLMMELLNIAPGAFIKQARDLLQSIKKFFLSHFSITEFKEYVKASPSHRGYPFYLEAARLHSFDAIQACLALEDIVEFEWNVLDKRSNTIFHLLLANSKLNNRERLTLIEIFLQKVYSLVTSFNVEGFTPYVQALQQFGEQNDTFGDRIITMLEDLENFELYKKDIVLHNTMVMKYHSTPQMKLEQVKPLMNPLQLCIRKNLLQTFKRLVSTKHLTLQWLCLNSMSLLQLAVEFDHPEDFLFFILSHFNGIISYYCEEEGSNTIKQYNNFQTIFYRWFSTSCNCKSFLPLKSFNQIQEQKVDLLLQSMCGPGSLSPQYLFTKQKNSILDKERKIKSQVSSELYQKRYFKLNKLVIQIFQRDYPLKQKEDLCVYISKQLQYRMSATCAQQLIQWIKDFNISLTNLFPIAPEDGADLNNEFWWAIEILPPERCLQFNVPQFEAFRSALLKFVWSNEYKQQYKNYRNISQIGIYRSCAFIGALRLCRQHLALEQIGLYDEVLSSIFQLEYLPYLLEMMQKDIEENSLRLTPKEADLLQEFYCFQVIDAVSSHFTKIVVKLMKEIQDEKKESCQDLFQEIMNYNLISDKEVYEEKLSVKERKILEIYSRLRYFRSKRTVRIFNGNPYQDRIIIQSSILLALSDSFINYSPNIQIVKDPKARLVLQASRLSQDMRTPIDRVLATYSKFLPLFEKHLIFNPLGSRLYYLRCPESYEVFAQHFNYSLSQFIETLKEGSKIKIQGLQAAITLYRRIKKEGRDYLLIKKPQDEEEDFDPEYALAIGIYYLECQKFQDFKAYFTSNIDLKLLPKQLKEIPLRFKEKSRALQYLQILGKRIQLQGTSFEKSVDAVLDLKSLMQKYGYRVPISILKYFIDSYFLHNSGAETISKIVYTFALEDKIDTVLRIINECDLKTISYPFQATQTYKQISVQTLRIMALLTSSNQRRKFFHELYFKEIGIKPEASLSLFQNLLNYEKYNQLKEVAKVLRQNIRSDAINGLIFSRLFEGILHLGKYQFFYQQMVSWLETSSQIEDIISRTLQIIMHLLKKRTNALRVIYNANGAVKKFLKEVNCYQDIDSVRNEYEELWRTERKDDVNYLRFEELKKEIQRQKKQKRPRSIKYFSIESLFALQRELPALITVLAQKLRKIKHFSINIEIAFNELMSKRISQALCTLLTQLSRFNEKKEEQKENQDEKSSDIYFTLQYATFTPDPALTDILQHTSAFTALLRHVTSTNVVFNSTISQQYLSSALHESVLLAFYELRQKSKIAVTEKSLKLAVKQNYADLFSFLFKQAGTTTYSPYSLLIDCLDYNSIAVLRKLLPTLQKQITKAQVNENHEKLLVHIESCCKSFPLTIFPMSNLQLSFFLNPKLETVQCLFEQNSEITERTIQLYCLSGNFDRLIWQAIFVKLSRPLEQTILCSLIYICFEQTRTKLLKELLPLYFSQQASLVCLEENRPNSFKCFAHYVVLSGDFDFLHFLKKYEPMVLESRNKEMQGKKECAHPFIMALLFKRYEFLDYFPLDPQIPLCEEERQIILTSSISSLQISSLVNNQHPKYQTERIEKLRKIVFILEKEKIILSPPRCSLIADVTLFPEKHKLTHLELVNMTGWNAKGLLHYAPLSIVCAIYPIEQILSLISSHLCSSNQPRIILLVLQKIAFFFLQSQPQTLEFKPFLDDIFQKTYPHEAMVISEILQICSYSPANSTTISEKGKQQMHQFIKRCLTIPNPHPSLFKASFLINYSLDSANFLILAQFLLHSSSSCTFVLYNLLIKILSTKQIKQPGNLKLFKPILFPREKGKSSHIFGQLPNSGEEDSDVDQVQMATHNLVLFFLLLRKLGNAFLQDQIQAETCLSWIIDSLLEPNRNEVASPILNLSRINSFLEKVQKVLDQAGETSQNLSISDKAIFNILYDMIRTQNVTLESGGQNQYKLILNDISPIHVENFKELRIAIRKVLLPIQNVRDFFDAVVPRGEIRSFAFDVKYSQEKGPHIQTISLNSEQGKGIVLWNLSLILNTTSDLDLQLLEERLNQLFYQSNTLLSLLEATLSKKWGTTVEIASSEFSSEDLRQLWELNLQEKRISPIDRVRRRLEDQLKPLCGAVSNFPIDRAPGPYLSQDEVAYFKVDDGGIKLALKENGEFYPRIPPESLEQIGFSSTIDRPFHSIVLCNQPLRVLNRKFTNLTNLQERTTLFVSFDSRSKAIQPCLYSHPDGIMLKILSIAHLKMLEITWQVSRKLNSLPLIMWKTLFMICEKVEPSNPLEFYESLLMDEAFTTALTNILLTYENANYYKGINFLLFDFELISTFKKNEELKIMSICYSCYRDAIVAKIILGNEPNSSLVSLQKLTNAGAMARDLLKFQMLVEAFSDLREIFKEQKQQIEQTNSIVIKLDFKSFVALTQAKFGHSEDPILEMKNYLDQATSLENLTAEIAEFFENSQLKKTPVKCLSTFNQHNDNSLVYKLFKDDPMRSKTEPYLNLEGEDIGHYQNVLLFAIRESDALRILTEKKGPTPRAVVGIKEITGKPKFIYAKCKEKQNGKLFVGTQPYEQFEIVLWTAPYSCDYEANDAIGPVFLVGTNWDLYNLPKDDISREKLLDKIKNEFPTHFTVQFFENEETLPSSLSLSTVPYILTDTGLKSVWNKVKRPLTFFLTGNPIFSDALFELQEKVRKIYNQFRSISSFQLKLPLKKFKALQLNLENVKIDVTSLEAPLFISNLALAINLFSQFLQEVFQSGSSSQVESDFFLSTIPQSYIPLTQLFTCFTEIFSSICLSLTTGEQKVPEGSFDIKVEENLPQDIYETRRKIEVEFYQSLVNQLMHKLSSAQILNSTFTRFLKKNPSLSDLLISTSFEAPILRLKHLCNTVHIDIPEREKNASRQWVIWLINFPTILHNIANSLLIIQPLLAMKSKSGVQLRIVIGAKFISQLAQYDLEQNIITIKLIPSGSLNTDFLFESFAKSLQLRLPSPRRCAGFGREFGCLLEKERNELNFILLQFDQTLARKMELQVFLCSFDQNRFEALQFQIQDYCHIKVNLPSPCLTRVFWILIIGEQKQIFFKKLYIRLTQDLENENSLIKMYRKRENCYLVGTDCFEVMKPVIFPEVQRGQRISHHLKFVRLSTQRSLHRKLVLSTEMRITQKQVLVKLERAEKYEEAKGGSISFLDKTGTRYLPFTNRRMQEEGCQQNNLYWPTGVQDGVIMTVLPELPRQIKEEQVVELIQEINQEKKGNQEETKDIKIPEEKREKAGLVVTRYDYEGSKELRTFKSQKNVKEKLNLYDLKVSLEVVLNVFLSSELAYESLQLSYIQKKKLKVFHKMLDGKHEKEALNIPRIVKKLILHPKSLKGYPVSRAGHTRVEELDVGSIHVQSAHFLHLVLANQLVEVKISKSEANKVLLKWTPQLKGVYQLFINGKLATVPHYQFVVLSSLHFQTPKFVTIPIIPKEMTVAKNIELTISARDKENCIVMPEDYELGQMPIVKKEISDEIVNLGINGELKAEIRNLANKDQLGTYEFTFNSSDLMNIKFTFFHQTEEMQAGLDITWNGATILSHKFLLKPKNFEERFQDFRKEIRGVLRGNRDVQISRFHYVESIGLLPASVLKPTSISVKFNGEPAWDAGGPRKEFFSMLGEEFTKSKNPRFFMERKPMRFFPVSLNNNPEHKRQLRNFGTLLAIGVAQGFSLEFRCTPALHAALSGISMRKSLLGDEDPAIAKNLNDMRHMDAETIESLQLYFVYSDFTGKEIELVKGGKNKKVSASNLSQYIKLVGQFLCYKCAEEEISEIKKGMNLVFSSTKFANFSCEEMNLILSGDETISRQFLKGKLHFYNEVSQAMRGYIKQWIDEAKDVELHNFLQLITGSRNVSQSEKRNFRINIDRSGDTSRIPSASTCGNQLHLPPYQSYEELKKKLDMSVNLGAKYFAFG